MKVTANAKVPLERQGTVAEVCGIRDIETDEQARQFNAPIGSKLYLVEFGDGESVEIPAGSLEPAAEEEPPDS